MLRVQCPKRTGEVSTHKSGWAKYDKSVCHAALRLLAGHESALGKSREGDM